MAREARTANSSYKKLAVQWLYEALCFVSSSLMADSFVLRNRQLLVAANRYQTSKTKTFTSRMNDKEIDELLNRIKKNDFFPHDVEFDNN